MTQPLIEKGDTTEDTMSLKRVLSQKEWIEEARQIPLEQLPLAEQALLIRCINKDTLSDEDLNKIEEILGRYREALVDAQPEETIQAVRDNIQHIHDCDTLLEKIEQVRNEAITTVPFNIPTKEGQISMELDVYPITDSTILFDPNSHFAPFMRQQEEDIIDAVADGDLTVEDLQVRSKVAEQTRDIMNDEISYDMMIELLANQTCLHGEERDPEKMEKIYRAMPSVYVAALTTRVQPLILDAAYNLDMDAVFQAVGH